MNNPTEKETADAMKEAETITDSEFLRKYASIYRKMNRTGDNYVASRFEKIAAKIEIIQ